MLILGYTHADSARRGFFNDHLVKVHAINFTPDCVFICHPDRGHASYEDAQRARQLKDSLLEPWDDLSVDHASYLFAFW